MRRDARRWVVDGACGLALVLGTFALPPVAAGQDVSELQRLFLEVYLPQGKYREAEATARQALRINEAENNIEGISVWHQNLGLVRNAQGRPKEAVAELLTAMKFRVQFDGPESGTMSNILSLLGGAYAELGEFGDAEKCYKRSIAMKDRLLGPNSADAASTQYLLAYLYVQQERFGEAEPLFKKALAVLERTRPDSELVAECLQNFGILYYRIGRLHEAEIMESRAIELLKRLKSADYPVLADYLSILGSIYSDQGRLAKAEQAYLEAHKISERAFGPDHLSVLQVENNLAAVYQEMKRLDEAAHIFDHVAKAIERTLGPQHPDYATALRSLATIYGDQKRYKEAEEILNRALELTLKYLGPDNSGVADYYTRMGTMKSKQGQHEEALKLYHKSAQAYEKALGPDHPQVGSVLLRTAFYAFEQGRTEDAEELTSRAITIFERAAVDPSLTARAYFLRARIGWTFKHRNEAVADLRHALELVEQRRSLMPGSEKERSEAYSEQSEAFELMVKYQAELGDVSEAFSAMERLHARSLLEEMSLAGSDLDLGRSAREREEARQREGELKSRIATIEKKLETASLKERESLHAALAAARDALYKYHGEQRTSSQIYHALLSTNTGAVRLSQIQRKLLGEDGRMLFYLIGSEGSYVLSIAPQSARMAELKVSDAEANTLGIKPGPLTAEQLDAVLIPKGYSGVMAQLSDPKTSVTGSGRGLERLDGITETPQPAAPLAERLAALWRVLVPEEDRKGLVDGSIKRLTVVPDGSLALFPFEVLVTEPGDDPKYLLDVGPPIAYAPSATVLYNLTERPVTPPAQDREYALTVGDPAYPQANPSEISLAPAARYGTGGGRLSRLPFSGVESQAVVKAFHDHGIKVAYFQGKTATEAGLRYWGTGRAFLHLACHGLADTEHGNFFGALALAPGPNADKDSADDGFLTLSEIYGLNLKSCEMVILSACQTNYGPRQKGEGVWALSRGFLIAGARRVVASNWVVDDEAAAFLVSRFCESFTEKSTLPAGTFFDATELLRDAKRSVRRQEKWKHPYFWASLVFVGPP